ncbi:thiol:disulfide interchange protein DsbA/DsbL [Sulfurivirga sp.]|uniref:thiol:disulfide interchange protein DsbA/DsbL n=1 Tax=Sulfurivirga sp. TaxID=2614236 RepID=UPI0025E408EE|nr:thiol:disulfide interchange protein DsbA/DsbL [Sulfurivirga sp.]
MKRRHFLTLTGAGALVLTSRAWADDPYMLDVEYKKVPVPHPEKKVVTEFFFYGCPHCWHLEPSIEAWLKRKPKDVTFRRMPAVLNSPAWIFFARAFFTAENLGVLEQSHKALFDALHRDRMKLFTVEKLAAWYTQFGVKPEDYEAMFKSFKVDAQVKEAAKLTKDFGIDGVPAVVVNGTWLTDVSMAGGRERLWQLVDWLVQR